MQFKDHKPIFLQIAERICDEILGGKYPEGERLPSVREYAAEVEVNVNTVVRSFEWLSQKGIIFNKGICPRKLARSFLPGDASRVRRTNAKARHHSRGS